MADSDNIQYGDKVLLMKEKNIQIGQIQKSKKVNVDKQWFNLNGAVGHPYGTTFEAKGNSIHPVIETVGIHNVKSEDSDKMRDNRNIRDTSDSQKMSREAIEELRNQGEKGEEVVRQLIENSSTFNEKTEYSKEKYIKKKTKKHVNKFTIVRPSTRLIAEMYYNKGPAKINNLRMDALAQMLTFGDVKGHNRQLVVESCNGLLLAATIERMGGYGTIVQLHAEQEPPRQALEGYNFTTEHYQMLHTFPLKMLGTVSTTVETPQTSDQIEDALEAPPNKRARLEEPEASNNNNGNSNKNGEPPVLLSEASDKNESSQMMEVSQLPSPLMAECTEISPTRGETQMEDDVPATVRVTAVPQSAHGACCGQPEVNDVNNANSNNKESAPVLLSVVADKNGSSETTEISELPSPVMIKCAEVTPARGEDEAVPITGKAKAVPESTHIEDPAKKAAKAEQERRKRNRQKQLQTSREILQEGKFDSLLVATRVHPTPVVVRLLDFLSDSRPVTVFSPYQEPLIDCYQRLRDSGRVVHLRLSETWLRNYQVLPNRTHPEISMSMNGGYLLTFIKVSDLPAPPSTA